MQQIHNGHEKAKVQQGFLKYTGLQMKFTLANTNIEELEKYKVKASDRAYQLWERNSLSIDLSSRACISAKVLITWDNFWLQGFG